MYEKTKRQNISALGNIYVFSQSVIYILSAYKYDPVFI